MFYCLLTQKMGQTYGGKDDDYDCHDEAVLFISFYFVPYFLVSKLEKNSLIELYAIFSRNPRYKCFVDCEVRICCSYMDSLLLFVCGSQINRTGLYRWWWWIWIDYWLNFFVSLRNMFLYIRMNVFGLLLLPFMHLLLTVIIITKVLS